MRYLLDTHCLLWAIFSPEKLSKSAREQIKDAENDIFVSVVSFLEISLKYALKNPNVDDIMKAAKTLGLNPVKQEKSYPKRWWRKEGRVLIDKEEGKVSSLIKISHCIKQSKTNI